jgi:hypothetical protein
VSDYWRQTAKKILAEYRAHPNNWREQPTIRQHLCPDDIDEQHETYVGLIDALCRPLPFAVVELGGGFGGLAALYWGFTGDYLIADLPDMVEFQRSALGDRPIGFLEPTPEGIAPPNDDSLFIATFSLSEMDLAERAPLEPVILKFRHVFLAWTRTFHHIDNDAYFSVLRETLEKTHETTTIHRSLHRHRYLIASRR